MEAGSRPWLTVAEFHLDPARRPLKGVVRSTESLPVLFFGGGIALLLGISLAGVSYFAETASGIPVFAAVLAVTGLIILILGVRGLMRGRIVTIDPDADLVTLQGLGAAAAGDVRYPLSRYQRIVCRREANGFRVELDHMEPRLRVPLLITTKKTHAQVRQEAETLAHAVGKPVQFD
ncbi:hypothetical protein [Magnetospira sp. QH-2]|uniref:hypothetical protein n=1 Tax=Magnetospira sp. (strain QH-2) TaxID=1288970 RepID=UPI0003E81326|nr:hypothetical protein [Magnetospira sp. QH-2]CCQ74681.1 protein of unknown function [Magnetospira sp. QH-2]